jgi:hypothetical protein
MFAHNTPRQSPPHGPIHIRIVRGNIEENKPSSRRHQHIYELARKGYLHIAYTCLKPRQQLPTLHIGDKGEAVSVLVAPETLNIAACVSWE